MKREIKFRAYGEYGEWDDETDAPKKVMCYDLAFEEYEPINDLLKDVENLMQYIGRKDDIKKDIYEGDIMEFHSSLVPRGGNPKVRTIVKWNEKQARFEGCWSGKVIGNIYENPELLEETK